VIFFVFIVALGGTYGIAQAAGASFGWATALAWIVAIVVAIIARRFKLSAEHARLIKETEDYQENERRASEFFEQDK
jgi:hypothetical protein